LLNPRPEIYTLPTTNESLAYALSEMIKKCNLYTDGDKSLPNTSSPMVAKFYKSHKIESRGVKSAISKLAISILEGNTDADGDFFGYWGTKKLMAKYEFYRELFEECKGITMSFEVLPWKKSKMNIKKSNLDNIINIEEAKKVKEKNA